MRAGRHGIALPVVLAALVALALLAALALFDGMQESRAAALAADQVRAEAALQEGIDAAAHPPGLALLCVAPPLFAMRAAGRSLGGGRYSNRWVHVGDGLIRATTEGAGFGRARARAAGLFRPDSAFTGGLGCPSALRLVPAGPSWLAADPGG